MRALAGSRFLMAAGLAGLTFGWASLARAEGMSAQDALKDILGGNASFQKNETLAKRRAEVAQSQSPQAIIVSCSDSRVPPEAVFNRYVGRLFVVRTAGHALGDYEFASIEYAVEHLKTPLLVVLGHERCGAIKATVEAVQAGGAEEHGDGHAAPADDADEASPAPKKHHRAERGRLSQSEGACAPKKEAHGHDAHAEEAGAGEDEEDADEAPPPKKTKKAKSAAHAEVDEDAEEGEAAPPPKKTKKKAHAEAEDAEDADEAQPAPPPKKRAARSEPREHISALVAGLEAPVREALKGRPSDPVDAAVRANTRWVVKRLTGESIIVKEAVEAGRLRVVGARYDLDTGAVELLE